MAEDTRKVLIVLLSVSFVLIVFIGLGLLFIWPGNDSARNPAGTSGRSAASANPEAWTAPVAPLAGTTPPTYTDLSAPLVGAIVPAPGAMPGTVNNYGDNIVILGDGSASPLPPATVSASPSAPATGNPAVPAPMAVTAKPYTPAPATPSTSRTPPAPASTPSQPTSGANASGAVTTRPASSTAIPAQPTLQFWIQAASLSNSSRAGDLRDRLISTGLSAIISLSEIDAATWYRVRIGPYQNRSEADGWLERVRALTGCESAYITEVTVRN
ncbi:MAG: hypothetical protein A2087_12920 [Spirochaetes bacterium GWD1_61_31]|nr:MAG: hypothetical protein A2Y37_05615 [Spirochaetes bacterium GWB1_60_80]OHD34394.1 MAG: hypothetical protein A2004_06970 [Spirochaetes bacterium GWC1_61_12]OHD35617.1 MAG: hypothetical protein A2087_12920 [Spirochaetes bacterium GWD1_61_31]OHD41655.1 MAG: hypothetical protein A2Y35_08935 [Spirochaetes bacterium GWE1_60_18]OHD61684.1 MAG: hypothetical protein A2Y32_03075 [Spirochaetes bacterium GWF1_60_12]HAP42897.1 hypothetical protein [Spirochaetaceae bacterium]